MAEFDAFKELAALVHRARREGMIQMRSALAHHFHDMEKIEKEKAYKAKASGNKPLARFHYEQAAIFYEHAHLIQKLGINDAEKVD